MKLIAILFTVLSGILVNSNPINPIFDPFGSFLQGLILNSNSVYYNSAEDLSALYLQFAELLQDKEYVDTLFQSFLEKYSKHYATADEIQLRKSIFITNLLNIFSHNSEAIDGKKSYTLTVNQFSDLTVTEIINSFTGYWPSNTVVNGSEIKDDSSYYADSTSFDPYRAHDVTPIQNQGSCGACVYFAAAATIESFWARKGNTLTVLSPQQLNDCARDEAHGNHGCAEGGGTFVPTFDYIKAHGLTSMANYPYIASDADCIKTKEASVVAKISSWAHVTPAGNENALKTALEQKGPIAVAIHVNDKWANYKQGVFDEECSGGRNHAVLLVGYGFDAPSNKDYWIVKNQWGEGFGEKGYIRMRRNNNNMCDIAGDAVWVA
jgi:cathepsin L